LLIFYATREHNTKKQDLGSALLGSGHNRVNPIITPFIIVFDGSICGLTPKHDYDTVPLKKRKKVNLVIQ